mgnify:CR=1 FL=1
MSHRPPMLPPERYLFDIESRWLELGRFIDRAKKLDVENRERFGGGPDNALLVPATDRARSHETTRKERGMSFFIGEKEVKNCWGELKAEPCLRVGRIAAIATLVDRPMLVDRGGR